jgi:two-component SAPR family response regulator
MGMDFSIHREMTNTAPEQAVIVFVDDDSSICLYVEKFFEKFNPTHLAYVFTDPYEALEFIKDNVVDVLISDFMLNSDINGIELCYKARTINGDIKTAILTSCDHVDFEKFTKEQDYVDYFYLKPIDGEVFLREIEILKTKEETILV